MRALPTVSDLNDVRIEPLTPADEATVDRAAAAADRAGCSVSRTGARSVTRPWWPRCPRLPDGTPFPTTFYLTCPRAVSACSTLEASGLMAELTDRLVAEPDLAAHYADAHRAYLAARDEIAAASVGVVEEIAAVSRRRDADPGQVPARAARSRAGRRDPGSTRSVTSPWS